MAMAINKTLIICLVSLLFINISNALTINDASSGVIMSTNKGGVTFDNNTANVNNSQYLQGTTWEEHFLGNTGYIGRLADDYAIENSVFYQSGIKIGLWTLSPTTELEVNGSINASNYYGSGKYLTNVSFNNTNIAYVNRSNTFNGNLSVMGNTSISQRLAVGTPMSTIFTSAVGGNSFTSGNYTVGQYGNVYRQYGDRAIFFHDLSFNTEPFNYQLVFKQMEYMNFLQNADKRFNVTFTNCTLADSASRLFNGNYDETGCTLPVNTNGTISIIYNQRGEYSDTYGIIYPQAYVYVHTYTALPTYPYATGISGTYTTVSNVTYNLTTPTRISPNIWSILVPSTSFAREINITVQGNESYTTKITEINMFLSRPNGAYWSIPNKFFNEKLYKTWSWHDETNNAKSLINSSIAYFPRLAVGTKTARETGDINGSLIVSRNLSVKNNIELTGNFTGNQIYGEMWNKSDTGFEVVDLVTTDVYVKVNNLTAGSLNGFTVNNGNLTAQVSGMYHVNAKVGAVATAIAGEYGMKVYVNEVGQNNCYDHEEPLTAPIGFIITCLVRLNVGDRLNVRFDDHADPVRDLTLLNANVNAWRIGN